MSTVTTATTPATAPDASQLFPEPTQSIPQVLARVAAWRGDAVAVSCPGQELTYRQVADGSRALAARLLAALPAGVAPDAPVALLASASPASVLATMAVVATGHPFVVLDTQLPVGRLRQVQQVAGAVLCIADADLAERARQIGDLPVLVLQDEVAALDGAARQTVDAPTADADLPPVSPTAPACVVFTSGSTGAPKGVIHSHRFLVAQAEATTREYSTAPQDYRVAALTSSAFVAGTSVIFIVLLSGGSLHLYDPRERGTADLSGWLRGERISAISLTPSLLRSLVKLPGMSGGLPGLRVVALGGEAVLGTDVRSVWATLGPCAVAIGYGSSETMSVTSSLYLPGADLAPGRLPAGHRVPSKALEVVDEQGRPVPPGGTGMLRVTAAPHLLADGYLNAPPDLAALFSTNPDGSRSFLLRDLVRIDSDGLLHVVGRADDAVKVRGYLVEPAEVEDALRAQPGITEAAVIAVPSGSTSVLVGYAAVTEHGLAPSPAALRLALRATLPDWMVPAEVVVLTALPRNERGKVDRAALPRPVRPPFEGPQGAAEEAVGRLWSALLGRDDIGRHDSFLALGGDSLAVEELITRVRTEHGVPVTVAGVVENPTVAEFARLLDGGSAVGRRRAGARGVPAPGVRGVRSRSLVVLRATGSRAPLFCVCGAGGSARAFWPLAAAVGADQPVYALQPHGMDGAAVPSFSVTMAARRYLRTIRRVQPRGPYFLAGHSMGGLVALEVARRLRAAGEEVRPVVLLDTSAPPRALGAPLSDVLDLVLRQDGELWSPADGGTGAAAAAALSVLSGGQGRGSAGAVVDLRDGALGGDPAGGVVDARSEGASVVAGLAGVVDARDDAPGAGPVVDAPRRGPLGVLRGAASQVRSLALASTNRVPLGAQEGTFYWFGARTSMLHRPRPWQGDAVLVRTVENLQPASAWSSVVAGALTTVDVPGNHTSMLRPPYVAAVAEQIAALSTGA